MQTTEAEASQIIGEMIDSYNKPLSLIDSQAWVELMTKYPKQIAWEVWKRWTAGNKFFPLRDEWEQLADQVKTELNREATVPAFPNTPWRERNFNLSLLTLLINPLVYKWDIKDIMKTMGKQDKSDIAKTLYGEGIFERLRELYPEFKDRIYNFEKDYCKAFKIKTEKQTEPKKELWFNREQEEIKV